MSEIRVDSITDEQGTGRPAFSNGVQTSNINGGQIGGRRSLIINGAMQVAQRGTSVTNTLGNFDYRTVDRFRNGSAGSIGARYTISQATDAPDGFTKSLKYECTTADASQSSDEYVRVDQRLEGLDLQGLAFGTSSAKSLTISFWVKSSVTGSYSVTMNTSNDLNTRQRVAQYTINSADTWEKKILTVEGDTDSGGTIRNTNEFGLILFWGLRAGSTYNSTDDGGVWHDAASTKRMYGQDAVVGANVGETWQITGVQLEVGDTATEFEHRSYGEELALCQRYYQQFDSSGFNEHIVIPGYSRGGTNKFFSFPLPVTMRSTPSVSVDGATRLIDANDSDVRDDDTDNFIFNGVSPSISILGNTLTFYYSGSTSSNRGNTIYNLMITDNSSLFIDAEL